MQKNSSLKIRCSNILDNEITLLQKDTLKNQHINYKNKYVAILLTGKDIASEKYVNTKSSLFNKVGVNVKADKKEQLTEPEILRWIDSKNNDSNCIAIVVQYPIFNGDRDRISNFITPFKDLDAICEFWLNKLQPREKMNPKSYVFNLVPPTAYAAYEIMTNIEIFNTISRENNYLTQELHQFLNRLIKKDSKLKVHVVGDSRLTGYPITSFIKLMGYKVTTSNIDTSEMEKKRLIEESDVIITSVGKKNIIPTTYFTNSKLLIDFGRTYQNGYTFGDVQYKKLENNVIYTALYKSTGAATLAGLVRNLRLLFYYDREEINEENWFTRII